MAALLAASACGPEVPEHTLIPLPTTFERTSDAFFEIGDSTVIVVDEGDAEAERIGRFLAELVGNTVENRPRVTTDEGEADGGAGGMVRLTRSGAPAELGPEGYALQVDAGGVVIRAAGAAGLFYGVQTLRQLLPPLVEYTAAYAQPLRLPAVRVEDHPRFRWRGAMLDVSRHFLTLDEVKRFVDLLALYKLNRLHLHLSDDQGWRVEIPGWPELTERGGSTEVGGGHGGFYTLEEYGELVRYADERFVMVVPEFDVPGHTHAALASYAELNCDGRRRELFTGTMVGFSALCPEKPVTYRFMNDVVGAIAARTTGPYFHVGGDEVEELSEEAYVAFMDSVRAIVRGHGKRMIGWDETAAASPADGDLVQLWRPLWAPDEVLAGDSARAEAAARLREGLDRAVAAGAGVILSPADRIYMDMKYDSTTVLGLRWAGYVTARTAYDWRVPELFGGVDADAIEGVEGPLWSETLGTVEDFEYMAFPRLTAVAELGWSRAEARSWEGYRARLAAHGPRLTALGVNYYRSPLVPWRAGPRSTR